MRNRTATILALSVLSICSLVASTARAQDSEKRVKIKDLPEVVQKTVREKSKGATVRGLSKEIENGKTYYEAELKVNGHNKDVLMDSTGAIVEIEETVALNSLPPQVKAAIREERRQG